ncbi:MAG: hypothetical protein HFI81_06385 [Eubacterium sp.]|nr:hypothetical protein [Eubacterium sp.]
MKKLYGAAKFANKVYNEYGGVKKYNRSLRKEGAILALLTMAASLKLHGFIAAKLDSLETKAERLSKH